jgi:hypothetical protein
LAFFAQTTANFYKKSYNYIGFLRKTPIFFAENWQKSQKIAIITSTPEASFLKASSRLRNSDTYALVGA